MKRILLIILSTSFLFLALSSCIVDFYDDNDGPCIRGSGPVVSETINVPDFTGISLDISANVYITQGPEFRVKAEGYANIIDELNRRVRNGVWEITLNDCVRNTGDLTLYITMPEVQSVHNTSSGDIVSENILVTDDIYITNSGSGDIDLGLDADDIDARLSGSGKLFLEGEADELTLDVTGSGDYRGFKLKLNRADIRTTGSGDAEIWVLNYLKARISGSGDILYRGSPQIDFSGSGSGDLINAN
ncbi:MAG: DUF2807 domain-containing protein [Haliscomenobacter sp.]|nr:DUF2807 domain-containing protein [Haliscomenobacter sp.]